MRTDRRCWGEACARPSRLVRVRDPKCGNSMTRVASGPGGVVRSRPPFTFILSASSGRASTKATAPTAVAISTMPALACLRGERDDQEVWPSVDRAPHSGCCWELFVCQGLGSRRGGLLDGCAEKMILGNDVNRFLCAACPVMTCGLRSPRRGWPKRAVVALCWGRP